MKPVDLVCGSIMNIESDRLAGWNAFFKKDAECEVLKAKLRKIQALVKKYSKNHTLKNT